MLHPVERGAPLDIDNDDGLDLEDMEDMNDMEVDLANAGGYHIRAQDSDEAEWQRLELERQLKEVMNHLKDGHRRWDDDEPSKVPPLELYKKITLATRRTAEATRATALHILARLYKSDYADVPGEIIRPVIRDLLIQSDKPPIKTAPDEKRKEEPILKVAITFNNDEFIHQVKEAWPEGFPALLDAKDSDGKNALHHIFAWPDEKATTRPEADAKMVLKRAMEFVPVATKETVAAKDAHGNTPIHYATDYRQCYLRTDEYVAIYKDMVRKGDDLMRGERAFNERGESPILYGQRTLAHCERIMKEKKSEKERTAAISKPTQVSTSSTETIEINGRPSDRSKIKESLRSGGSRRMSMVDECSMKENQSGSASTMMSSIIDMVYDDARKIHPPPAWPKQPPAAKVLKEETVKPAPEKKVAAPATTSSKKVKGKARAYNAILQFLRLHYIRSRPDMEVRDLVYGKDASDKNLYFDASGHSQADNIITLLDRMSAGGFQDTLAYVYIPGLEQAAPVERSGRKAYGTNRGRPGQVLENPKMGRSDLVGVFDKLSSCGVKRILRLEVDDLEGPSHTDSAIEMALLGRESDPFLSQDQTQTPVQPRNPDHPSIFVETWDWRKPDINPDVIAATAPGVEHVNLYWSGNQATLRGWGSPAGIAQLANLKTLQVYASPGFETVARMNMMLEIFKNEIITNTNGRVKEVKIIPRINGLIINQKNNEEQADPTTSQVGVQITVAQRQPNVWVSTMDEFRKSMMSIHGTLRCFGMDMEPYRIKVALIDDGLDLNQLLTYNNTVKAQGQSYYPPNGRMENPWHCSTAGQGTVMANMIARINPWVSLHAMRVHGVRNKRPTALERASLAESAAKAIWGAIRRRVHIISISWTLKAKKPPAARTAHSRLYDDNPELAAETEAIRKLEAALDEAVRQDIVIFCSASDRIDEAAADSLPYRQAADHAFRIGAALPYGQPAPETGDGDTIDYFFPGSQVAEDFNPRGSKMPPRFHDGSSVATALAAGLASLVMYCAAVMREYNKEKPGTKDPAVQDYYAKAAAALQSRDNMKQAFDNIGIGKPEDKYLEVWREFGAAAEKIAALGTKGSDTAEKNRKKMELLDELTRRLCHKARLDDVAHGQFGA